MGYRTIKQTLASALDNGETLALTTKGDAVRFADTGRHVVLTDHARYLSPDDFTLSIDHNDKLTISWLSDDSILVGEDFFIAVAEIDSVNGSAFTGGGGEGTVGGATEATLAALKGVADNLKSAVDLIKSGTDSIVGTSQEISDAVTDTDDIVPVTNPPPTDAGNVTIANGASLSGAIQIDGKLAGLAMPAGWTAAGVEFQSSLDNVTFRDVYNGATKYSISAVVAGAYHAVDPIPFFGVKWLKVRSATAGTPVAQGADRVIAVRKAG